MQPDEKRPNQDPSQDPNREPGESHDNEPKPGKDQRDDKAF